MRFFAEEKSNQKKNYLIIRSRIINKNNLFIAQNYNILVSYIIKLQVHYYTPQT